MQITLRQVVVHVGFVVERVVPGQVSLRVLRFSINIIPPWHSILIYCLMDKQQACWWPQFRDVDSSHQDELLLLPDNTTPNSKAHHWMQL
jgi:hypothetical protein